MIITLLSVVLFVASAVITRQLIVNSHRFSKMDIPNERSSHITPTPRGGGIAFVLTSLIGFLLLLLNNALNGTEILALCCAGSIVATAGHLDDRQKISGATVRLVLHAISAVILVVGVGIPPELAIIERTVNTGIIGLILGVIYLVWLLNLFNFMDGTDGIAASEVIFVALAGAFLNFHVLSDANHSAAAVILAVSTFGFILYNWSPAKIFMGDVGSGYLGIVVGGLSLIVANQDPDLLWVWIILLAAFVSDATVTLIRRLLRRQKPHVAHRSHAYQHLAIRFHSHPKVALLVLAVNIAWLLPIAFLVADKQLAGTTGVIIAYLPLLVAALAFGAGKDSATN
ncbi:glycosyltransferase WbpL [Actinomycetes bacterium]|nr:glycosyltransferase WbpL [Actinomycetes bacterium]